MTLIQQYFISVFIHEFSISICENPGQRWLTGNIFSFNREYLLNYRRYGKTINMFFVATSMYFSKMQKFSNFEVFKGVKRYDEKNFHFWWNRQFSHILLRSPNEVDLLLGFFILKSPNVNSHDFMIFYTFCNLKR